MEDEKSYVSCAEFEMNLFLKKDSPVFNNDIRPLLSLDFVRQYKIDEAYEIIFKNFSPRLTGEPWKST